MKKSMFITILLSVVFLGSCEKKRVQVEKSSAVERLINECGWQNITPEDIISITPVRNKSVWVKPYARCPGCDISGHYFQDKSITGSTNSFVFMTCQYNGKPSLDSTMITIRGSFIQIDVSRFAHDTIFPFYLLVEETGK